MDKIQVSGIHIEWLREKGTCTFENLPVAMMWVNTTLAGLMSGVQSMVGSERFNLALQSEGRKSVDADWAVISTYADFEEGFKAISNIAAVAGWGKWELAFLDEEKRECRFRIKESWEGLYQKALGVCWGSGMLAGKMAGYCSKVFETNCWAEQTRFIARGDESDEFVVRPSNRSIEKEIDNLLVSDGATRADMAVALENLRKEISERKQAEIKLRDSEEKYRVLFENASDAVFIAQDNVVKFPNRKTEGITGYSKTELKAIPFIDLICPQDQDMVMERHKKRLAGEAFPSTYSFRVINKSGEELWVQLNAVKITWEGRPATLNFLRDISQQRILENQLLKAQKMESIGSLAGGIAHDFNNILTPIIGMSELFLQDLPSKGREHDNMQQILLAAKRGADLVKQILAFSRQSDKLIMPVHLQQILKETLKLCRSTIPSNIEVLEDIQNDCGLVMADPTQMHQVVMNLITNAYHAVGHTGGKIFLSLKAVDLKEGEMIGSTLQGPHALISVSDTGCGIDQKIMDKIFEPYFTTKEQGKGTGLGLAVVYGIVKAHQGEIKISTKEGEGTTFNVYLPLMEKASEPEKAEMAENHQSGNERILLVDDEELVVSVEKEMLERLGYHVTSRLSSLEALEKFKADPNAFDLVLTDMTMPQMTGDQLAKELIHIRPDIPIIICTGFSETTSREKTENLGIKGYLMKPILLSEMAKTVKKALEGAGEKTKSS